MRVRTPTPCVALACLLAGGVGAAAQGTPSIQPGGIVNLATYGSGAAVAPGSIAAVLGSFPVSAPAGAPSEPLPSSLSGLSFQFGANLYAPLFYASGAQANVQVPWELAGQSTASVMAAIGGQTSAPQTVYLATYAPGIFATNGQGTGQGAIIDNSTYTLVDASNPATAGSTYIEIYCTGLGPVTNQPATGAPAPSSPPFATTTMAPTVTIGGVAAPALFAGLAPGFVGLYQVDVQVPATVSPGSAVPVAISIGGAVSNTVTIAVQTLVFSDEFNGAAGSLPNPATWTYDLGGGGWGNGEAEVYTNSPNNVSQDGKGNLAITVINSNGNYTSARIKTQGLYAPQYGKIEARIKLPYGQGIWPAFWMLGANMPSVGWPDCGEVDIMENFGAWNNNGGTNNGSIHGPGYTGTLVGATYTVPGGALLSADYHVFSIEWSENSIEFFVDGNSYEKQTPATIPSGTQWVFNAPFFFLLNVAVGGPTTFLGPPDASTVFPQTMLVDYVRVYALQ